MSDKSKSLRLWKISALITLIINAALLVLVVLSVNNVFNVEDMRYNYVYYNGALTSVSPKSEVPMVICYICLASVMILTVASCIVLVVSKIKNKAKVRIEPRIFSSIFLCFVTLIIAGIFALCYAEYDTFNSEYEPEFYEFSNDDRRIIICEKSWLLGGWADVYQIYDDNTAWQIGTIHTNDGYRNRGKYDIEWQEDGAAITYGFDYRSDTKEIPMHTDFFSWVDE